MQSASTEMGFLAVSVLIFGILINCQVLYSLGVVNRSKQIPLEIPSQD